MVYILPLGSGSVDPHIFEDPHPGSQNLADPMYPDPDPKHCDMFCWTPSTYIKWQLSLYCYGKESCTFYKIQLLAVKTFYSQSKSCTNFHSESRCQEINIFLTINVFKIFYLLSIECFCKNHPKVCKNKIGLIELGEIMNFWINSIKNNEKSCPASDINLKKKFKSSN